MIDAKNEEAFDNFVRSQRDRLVGQAYLLVGSIESAQDLAQRALEQTWRHWKRVVNYESPEAWTRRILFNMALNERRRW